MYTLCHQICPHNLRLPEGRRSRLSAGNKYQSPASKTSEIINRRFVARFSPLRYPYLPMCELLTMYEIDFSTLSLDGEDAREYMQGYVIRRMGEAYRMDCHQSEFTSMGNSTQYQRCELGRLQRDLGDGIRALYVPEIQGTGHHAGRRVKGFKGGMC